MAVVVACLALMVLGLVAVVRWGGLSVVPPRETVSEGAVATGPPPVGLILRRYVWYLAIAIGSGAGAGLLASGPGGRLVMRLLAVTAGGDAQGRLTEAQEIVGRIT